MLEAGASKVGINTAAVRDPELVRLAADAFGRDRIVVAIDAATAPDAGKGDGEGGNKWVVCTCGGKQRTQLDLVEWACTVERLGAGEILLTSIDRDGAADGYDLRQLRAVTEAVSIPVIASGGAGAPEHFRDAFAEGGADAALAASVFHFGLLRVGEVKQYLASEGVDARHDGNLNRRTQAHDWIDTLKFDDDGLIPAVVQDADSLQVLMVAT